MRFTNDEAVDMLAVYFECLLNAAITKRVYAARYPNRRPCDVRAFPRLVASLRANGSFRPTFQQQVIGRTQEKILPSCWDILKEILMLAQEHYSLSWAYQEQRF